MPKTLLLADDSVTIQKVVGITFANEDVELVTVDNGDDALVRAREVRPDLVMADVSMPGLNGYELCAALKREADLARIPVLLLTGTFETYDAERAAEVGADGYIAKPFEAQALVDQVQGLLERAAAAPPPPPPDPQPSQQPAAPQAPAPRPAARQAPPPQAVAPPPPQRPEPEIPEEPFVRQPAPPELSFSDMDLEPSRSAEPTRVFEEPGGRDELRPDPSALASPASPLEPSPERFGSADPAELSADAVSSTAFFDPLSEEPDTAEPHPQLHVPADTMGLEATPGTDPMAARSRPARPAVQPEPPAQWDEPLAPAEPPVREAIHDLEPLEVGEEALEELADSGESEPFLGSAPHATAARPAPDPSPAAARPAPGPPSPPLQAPPAAPPAPVPDPTVLREAVEKVAWEAFGPLAEQLVREAVKKVEQVAWEVVPQLAERLIREELERIKDETPDD